jgi:hypothetical protein
MKNIIYCQSIVAFFYSFSYGQMTNEYKLGFSLSVNSIHAQIEIPLMTSTGNISQGTGTVAVDADGNIMGRGDRIDNSYSLSIIPKYNLTRDLTLRFEFGFTNLKLHSKFDSKGTHDHQISNEQITTSLTRFVPGFQWNLIKKKPIEVYIGMSTSFVQYGDVNINIYQEFRGATVDTITSTKQLIELSLGGYSFGLGALTGFNIHFNHISLGTELSYFAMYYDIGGAATLTGKDYVPYFIDDTFDYSFNNSYKGFKLSKILTSFNISIWF